MDSSLDKKLLGFNKIAQEKLQNIFCQIPGKKDLVIEPILIKPLEHVCGVSWLKAKGVEKIYKFDQKNPPQKQRQLIYFVSSNLLMFKFVLDQIHGYENDDHSIEINEIKDYNIVLFPSVLKIFEQLLEEEGLFSIVTLHRFQWDFLTLDSGVLSLEIPQLFREIFIKYDYSLLGSLAHSLRLFNLVAKKPKIILSYGDVSEKLLDMVYRIENYSNKCKNEISQTRSSIGDIRENSDFTAMIVMDRNKDYPSCLMTPVVYAGFLAELFHLKTGTIQAEIEANRIKSGRLDFLEINTDSTQSEAKKDVGTVKLNSNLDSIYNDHKYLHFSDVISNLSAQAKTLGVEGNLAKTMKIDEMKDFVQNKLQKVAIQKKELFKHLILCETIMTEMGGNFEKIQDMQENMLNNKNRKQILSYIDECLSTGAHKYNTIRLMCLLHITMGGLTVDECNNFIKNYCNAFGYKYLSIFVNLSNGKLFPDTLNLNKTNILLSSINNLASSAIPIQLATKWQNQFQMDLSKLKLIPIEDNSNNSHNVTSSTQSLSQVNHKNSLCPSYVFNGVFIPLVAQLANILLKAQSFDELNTKLGYMEQLKISGKFYSTSNQLFCSIKEILLGIKKSEISDIFPLRPRTVFIFIVGGMTYAEIAACNLIEKLTSSKIVISSNCILSGGDVISAGF